MLCSPGCVCERCGCAVRKTSDGECTHSRRRRGKDPPEAEAVVDLFQWFSCILSRATVKLKELKKSESETRPRFKLARILENPGGVKISLGNFVNVLWLADFSGFTSDFNQRLADEPLII